MTTKSAHYGSRETSWKKTRGWLLDPIRILDLGEIRRLRGVLRERALRAQLLGHRTAVRDWFLVEAAFATGLRVSELAALTCGDFSLNALFPSLVVRRGKGGRPRVVRLSQGFRSSAVEFLEWKQRSGEPIAPDSPVFHSARSPHGLSCRALQKSFYRSLNRAGIEGHSIHDARHSHATYLLHVSKNVRLVQKQLGHARVTTTEIYAHVMDEEFLVSLNALDGLLA